MFSNWLLEKTNVSDPYWTDSHDVKVRISPSGLGWFRRKPWDVGLADYPRAFALDIIDTLGKVEVTGRQCDIEGIVGGLSMQKIGELAKTLSDYCEKHEELSKEI